MLKQRVITAIILLIIFWIILFHTEGAIFASACWIICAIAIYELAKMYKFTFLQNCGLLIINTLIALIPFYMKSDISQTIRIISVSTWCFIVPFILLFTPKRFPKPIIAAISVLIFIPAYYSLTVLHTLLGGSQLLSIMAIAWVADSGAYFVGRSIGKNKLAPHISPGKSIEGALGGMILVLIYLSILKYFNLTYYLPSYVTVFKFAFIVTTISIIGDLFESWLKRVANVKDSGNILPGHGGIFDRIDSLVAVLAISFAIIRGMV